MGQVKKAVEQDERTRTVQKPSADERKRKGNEAASKSKRIKDAASEDSADESRRPKSQAQYGERLRRIELLSSASWEKICKSANNSICILDDVFSELKATRSIRFGTRTLMSYKDHPTLWSAMLDNEKRFVAYIMFGGILWRLDGTIRDVKRSPDKDGIVFKWVHGGVFRERKPTLGNPSKKDWQDAAPSYLGLELSTDVPCKIWLS